MIVPVILFAAFFLILFFVIFFLSATLKKSGKKTPSQRMPAQKPSLIAKAFEKLSSDEELEELEAVEDTAVEKSRISNVQLAFGDDDIPFIIESSGFELVDEDLDEAIRVIENMKLMELEELEAVSSDDGDSSRKAAGNIASLEEIAAIAGSIFWHPFAVSLHNPASLESGEPMPEVIYEQNGIHYINNDVIGKNTEESLDSDFMRLVDSVVKR